MPAAFAWATLTWVLVLGLAPWAASQPHASSVVYGFAAAVYGVCSFLCHQIPERSFHLASAQFPVCARCTGIYIAGAVSAMAGAFLERDPARPMRARTARLLFLIALIPTLTTLVYEWTADTPSNWIRFAAGLPLGGVVAFLIIETLSASSIAAMRRAGPASDKLN
jgi:uncharacterized membrane protein